MDTIITDVLEILKDAEDSISWEERMRSYFAEYICNALGTAMERLDDEIVENWKQEGWHVERRDKRTILTSFGQMTFLRRRMKKEGEAGCYPLDDAMGLRKYQRMTAYFEYPVAQVLLDKCPFTSMTIKRLPLRMVCTPSIGHAKK